MYNSHRFLLFYNFIILIIKIINLIYYLFIYLFKVLANIDLSEYLIELMSNFNIQI